MDWWTDGRAVFVCNTWLVGDCISYLGGALGGNGQRNGKHAVGNYSCIYLVSWLFRIWHGDVSKIEEMNLDFLGLVDVDLWVVSLWYFSSAARPPPEGRRRQEDMREKEKRRKKEKKKRGGQEDHRGVHTAEASINHFPFSFINYRKQPSG